MDLLRPAAVLSSLLLGVHGVAWACVCFERPSLEEELQLSDDVVYGMIIEITKLTYEEEITTNGCNPTTFTVTRQPGYGRGDLLVRVQVEEAFLGDAELGEVLEFRASASVTSCSLPFREDEDWVLFATDGVLGGYCSRSHRVDDATTDLGLAELESWQQATPD